MFRKYLIGALLLFIVVKFPVAGFAQPTGFKITEIANNVGENSFSFYAWPGINENGQVCYRGSNAQGSSAILRGDGISRVIIEKTKTSPNFVEEFTSGICSINNNGDVVFDACKNCVTAIGQLEEGIYRGNGTGASTPLQLTSAGDTGFKSLRIPTINNNGVVSFIAERNNGHKAVWILDGVSLTSAFNNSGLFDEFGAAFINDQNPAQLTFGGVEDSVGGVIQRGVYGPNNANPVVGTFNGFSSFGLPVINSAGEVACSASKATASPGNLPESGVYLNGNPRVINNTGAFNRIDLSPFQNVSINDKGDVVFPAIRSNGNSVVFLSVGGGIFKLFEKGDLVPGYGSPISVASVGRESINNQRQISLIVTLQDKTQLVLRLDSDGFSVPQDNCPNDDAKFDPGICGCGAADSDNNSDGITDCKTTETVLEVVQSLSNSIRKVKKLKSNASKKLKKDQNKLKSETKKQLNQLLALVSKSGNLIKLKNTTNTPAKIGTLIKTQVTKALKTESKTFAKDKKKVTRTLSDFIKFLDV